MDSSTYGSVILLRDREGLSTQETAQILDVSDDVVKTRLHRARLAIRQRLDEYLRGDELKELRKEKRRMEPHQHDERCKDVFALLSDYLNLELPPEVCQEIEAHIADCSPCIEFTESLRKTVELCRQYQPTELPAPLGQAAKAQLLEAYGRMLDARRSNQPG